MKLQQNWPLRKTLRNKTIKYLFLVLALQAGTIVADEWLMPKGKHVLFGNYRLYYHCEGENTPTVIIDGGIGDASANWLSIQSELATDMRVCLYDRAGYGMSDPGPGPRSTSQIVEEIYLMMKTVGIPGPYLIVGQSFGGFTAQLFAKRYPVDTAGIVLVESSHPRQSEMLDDLDSLSSGERKMVAGRQSYEFVESDPWRKQWLILNSKRKAVFAQMEELKYFRQSESEVLAAGDMPDIPVAVLTRDQRLLPTMKNEHSMEDVWRELQRDLAKSSSQGWQEIVEGSSHNIHLDNPEAVIEAIRKVNKLSKTR
ncbi:MAG: alpha/beta fold hydrolase [Gammaproteobacteria bacterium]|nr:alpha/beta fold hydrolase [Gammaproteobacteria bacterium]